jgi:hypothetical protein
LLGYVAFNPVTKLTTALTPLDIPPAIPDAITIAADNPAVAADAKAVNAEITMNVRFTV